MGIEPIAKLLVVKTQAKLCDRKRAEGKRDTQALIALARRRVNVLWVMLRD
jgi:hypothetical protein